MKSSLYCSLWWSTEGNCIWTEENRYQVEHTHITNNSKDANMIKATIREVQKYYSSSARNTNPHLYVSSLCHTMGSLLRDLHTQISCGDYPVKTTFCRDYPYEHYVLWRLPLWTLRFVEITHMSTTFCGDYPCEHYVYVPWLIMTSQWLMTFLGISIVMSK